MMGYEDRKQGKLFYYNTSLGKRIRKDHPLRAIKKYIDFGFIYDEVKNTYGFCGNTSVPPVVVLKMMLLLVLYNVRSERELMQTIPERLDWLWFLGYDLDDTVPDHSVLSKARKRWGVELFRSFFERIVFQCVQAGLVVGDKIFMDSSLVQANAANNSVVRTDAPKLLTDAHYQELERRLEMDGKSGSVNAMYTSTTDPDASVTRKGAGKASLCYQTHRVLDDGGDVITATMVTPGTVNEAHCLVPLLEQHASNTERQAEAVVADTKYGTIENYLRCRDLGVAAHIPDLTQAQRKQSRRASIFSEEHFVYDSIADVYRCPAGRELKRRRTSKGRGSVEYKCSKKVCNACELRAQCTHSRHGRTISRHQRQEELDAMREQAKSKASRQDIKRRQWVMEGSFARSTRYGYKRARWRGLWRVELQELLIATLQNILALIKSIYPSRKPAHSMRLTSGLFHMEHRPTWKTRLSSSTVWGKA